MSSAWQERRATRWTSGDWSVLLRGDELADIEWRGRRVVRAIRFVARDADWRTARAHVLRLEQSADRVALWLSLLLDDVEISAELRLSARGRKLTASVDAAAEHVFRAQRVGLVLQHSASAAGADFEVTHGDGSTSVGTFPTEIVPHQPMLDIAALRWTEGRITLIATFQGADFEMEDQRNWTDASFKIYSPPLSESSPRELEAGASWSQLIELEVLADDGLARPEPRRAVRISLAPSGRRFPAIGVAASTAADDGGIRRRPPGHHLLVELDAAAANWLAALERAGRSGKPLDLRIVADEVDQLEEVLHAAEGLPVLRVAAFAGDTHVSERAFMSPVIGWSTRLGAEALAGTRAHFTELNRSWDSLWERTAVAFSLTPQMHVRESAQLVESIPMQRLVTEQATRLARGEAVHVGPISLRPRFNAVATSAPSPERADLQDGYGAAHVHGSTDLRQSSDELAAWTVASAAAVAAGGAASITYFEEWGPRGVRSSDGSPLPVLAAIEALAELVDAPLLVAPSIDVDERMHAVAVQREGEIIALVANLGDAAGDLVLAVGSVEHRVRVGPGSWRRAVLAIEVE